MEGAAIVLSANPASPLVEVLGQGVITANPFLTGKDAAYVIDWAERKMSGSRGAPQSAPPIVVSPEFRIYQAAIQTIMPVDSTVPGLPGDPAQPPPPDTAMIEPRRLELRAA
jgi:hypothetical protein